MDGWTDGTRADTTNGMVALAHSPRGRRPSPRTKADPRAPPPTSCPGEEIRPPLRSTPRPSPPPPAKPHLVRLSDFGRSGRSGAGQPLLLRPSWLNFLVVVVLLVASSLVPRFERTLPWTAGGLASSTATAPPQRRPLPHWPWPRTPSRRVGRGKWTGAARAGGAAKPTHWRRACKWVFRSM